MAQKIRLTGVDLFKGIAIYAVIVLHSDETITTNPSGWPLVLEFSKFAVPFFLATAFHLNFQKIYNNQPIHFPLQPRLFRLLIPYCIWSIFYLFYKCSKYFLEKDFSQINQLFSDPFALAFTGGAAFHLYFLPLLMVGTTIVALMTYLARRKIGLTLLGIISFLSLGVYQWLLTSGNEFNNSQGVALAEVLNLLFPTASNTSFILRAVAVFIAWFIRCLPYVTLAMLLSHPFIVQRLPRFKTSYLSIAAIAFMLINTLGIQVLPAAVYEVGRGFVTLGLALSISKKLNYETWMQSLGNCSFGIYLVHLVWVEVIYILLGRLTPGWISEISTVSLLSIALFILFLSWTTTHFLRRNPHISKVLLGG